MMKHLLVLFLLLHSFLFACAQMEQKRVFQNFDEGGALIRCFFQDSKGVVWVGASYGLGVYNGKGIQKHPLSDARSGWMDFPVYASLKQDDTHYYLGTEKGLVLFDSEQDTFQQTSLSDMSIRTLQWMNDSVMFLGTLNGLVRYDARLDTFRVEDRIPPLPIDPIVRLDSHRFFIASYQGLYLYDAMTDTFEYLSLPSPSSSLILSIAVDAVNRWVWIGTESGLWKYHVGSASFTKVSALSANIIKKIHIGRDASLWLGTDNGLYIYHWERDTYEHIVHSSRDNRSLVNNTIWSIFEDREQNIWLGTESGLSVYCSSSLVETYSWDSLVGSDEGNTIYCMYRDSRKDYWWGGSNGLGYYHAEKNKSLWFKMGQDSHSISHNRIRCIYEDWEGDLWVATDGGINRFNRETETFENYSIVDATRTLNANWAYYIHGDGHTHLYVAAYCGGVFVVNKKELLARKGGTYVSDETYSQHSGAGHRLHSNFITHATIDNHGCLWVGTGERLLEKIDFKEKKVYAYDLSDDGQQKALAGSIRQIVHDPSGNVWVAFHAGLCKITADNGQMEVIHTDIFHREEIQLLEDAGDWLWVATSRGVYAYHKSSDRFIYTGLGGSYTSLYNDTFDHKMWIGGIDQCLAFKVPDLWQPQRKEGTIVLGNLYVNENPVYPHTLYDGNLIADRSIGDVAGIRLRDNQNNLAFEFLDTSFDWGVKPRYLYRLAGEEEEWRNLEDLNSRISYTHLKPGHYVFELKELVYDGAGKDGSGYRLDIRIDHPWYGTLWAKGVYGLLGCLLVLWVVKYFHDKNRFRMEHIEREKTLELSNLKMEFLTNMSHELKTPLSLIIGPVGKLLSETKNASLKEKLSSIHASALRLNTIVHQILDVKDWTGAQQKFYPSPLELVTFVGSIVDSYREVVKDKGISLVFHCAMKDCFVEADIPKMEAIVNNLLSNACKFSPDGGEVHVCLNLSGGEDGELRKVCLQVTDNGVGIPAADLPHLFERFYQVGKHQSMNKEGSGVGLSMVKSYVELHDGEIQIDSEEGKGTSVRVFIPAVETEDRHKGNVPVSLYQEAVKYKVLIVEDNVDIAHFIKDNLRDAECLIAYNGKMGLELVQQQLPDIVIADIMMPVLDGIEMAKRMKSHIHTATIPIIMLTAKDDKKTEYALLALGVEAFLSKPFDMKELAMHIDRILQNKHRLVRKLKEEGIVVEAGQGLAESPDEKFLNYITEMIEQHLSDSDLNVTKLGELSGYHPKQIYRRIKQLTGYTAVDYMKGIRMKKAAMLLSQKQFMVSEVMYMVGFSDSSYFSKCFMEKYGKTPKQYMESR